MVVIQYNTQVITLCFVKRNTNIVEKNNSNEPMSHEL